MGTVNSSRQPTDPTTDPMGWGNNPPDIESSIFEALGAASMCWDTCPTGVFDSTRAMAIGNQLLERLRDYLR